MRGSFPKQHNTHTSTATTSNINNSNFVSSTTTSNPDNLDNYSFDQQQQQQQESNRQAAAETNNPFKYSKEFMLSLYKPNHELPFDFKQHEYVTTQDQRYSPLAFEELTEAEKKVRAF